MPIAIPIILSALGIGVAAVAVKPVVDSSKTLVLVAVLGAIVFVGYKVLES